MTNKNLPSLQELVSDVAIYEKQDEFNYLMNQEPPKKWIKKHPYIKTKDENNRTVPYEYLPIDKTEYLLRKIFKKYRIEILREGTSFNGVYVVCRVHYKDIITGEWQYHDGIGAIHLQVKSGSSAADLSNINNGALSMAYPLAKTLAIKDACDMFGKLFGADLNRRDTLDAALDDKKTNEDYEKEIAELLEVDGIRITEEDRLNIERILDKKESIKYKQTLKFLNSKLPKIKK